MKMLQRSEGNDENCAVEKVPEKSGGKGSELKWMWWILWF